MGSNLSARQTSRGVTSAAVWSLARCYYCHVWCVL